MDTTSELPERDSPISTNMFLSFEDDKSVLDVGCGLGSTVDTYGVPDHVAIYGIDVNAEVIEQTKLLHKDRPNRFF